MVLVLELNCNPKVYGSKTGIGTAIIKVMFSEL